jgi:hypothetical protein
MAQFPSYSGPISTGLLLAVLLALAVAAVFLLAPAWTCAPFRLGDLYDPGELPPPLPTNCAPTAEEPSEDTLRALDSQREELGLRLQETVTCKVSWSQKSRVHGIDMRWFQSLYGGGVLRFKRHVLVAATQDVSGGTLFTVERCLVPWWKYIGESGTDCWSQVEFWK